MTPPPSIVVTDYTPPPSEMKRRLYERLRSWADLVLLDPDVEHPDLSTWDLDLYHMARWTRPSLRDLRRAQAAGIPTVNSHDGAATTEDRLARSRRIESAGLLVPAFAFGTADEIRLAPPVLVKPRHELQPGGHDFSVVFAGPIDFEGERFVQRFVVPRRSYKVFQVGDRVRSTRYLPGTESVLETSPSRKVLRLVETAETLFDLRLFELDLVLHKGLFVIDVNPVVSLDGVHDAVDIYEDLLREASSRS